MTLTDFIQKYDTKGAIVLLEGKRDVADTDKLLLEKLGTLLASGSKYMRFRSGNAKGADLYFSQGVSAVNEERLEVITPYTSHRKKEKLAGKTYSLDDINLIAEEQVVYQSKFNKKTENLVDRYLSGDRDRYAIKSAYIIRDTVKVIGTTGIPPITFAFFYDDLDNPKQGGTGHTMNICDRNNVPYLTQEVWMEWL